MKILVISLLRLGDILLATSVLRSLRRQHPKAELHILINGQFHSVAKLIPFVDKVFSFDRDAIQRIIGSTDHNILEAYFRVEDLAEQLQTERYDQVINLTHNRLSGWLTALVGCQNTKGVVFGSHGRFSVGSSWFEYLNDFSEARSGNTFHFVDVFHYGAGLETTDRRIELIETDISKEYANDIFKKFQDKKRVLLQPCSAEAKKTLAPFKWRQIASMISKIEPDVQIFVLGAPNEQEIIDDICKETNFIPLICDLEQAFGVLNQSHLLITADTSIKHLATATKIKILEISIGSSEYAKTGAYTSGAVIIQGAVECAPCPHRTPCTKKDHECAEKITPEMVSMASSAILRQDEIALRTLAHEYKEDCLILRTYVSSAGDWSAYPLAESFSAREINNWVDRTSFKLYLQRTHEKTIGEYGTEGIELKQLLENIFPDRAKHDWVNELKNLEKDIVWFEAQVGDFLSKLKEILQDLQNPAKLRRYLEDLNGFCYRAQRSGIFQSYGRQISLSLQETSEEFNHFQIVKRLREKLTFAHQRSKIELKLIRDLQNGFMEVI